MSATVAGYIVEALRAAGTDTFFGVPGVHNLALWATMERAGARFVGLRHEQAAAHAADGYGRAGGRPGAVFLPSGPGALAALSALGEALVSSSPVVAVAATIPSRLVGKGRGHLHEARDSMPVYEAVTAPGGGGCRGRHAAAAGREAHRVGRGRRAQLAGLPRARPARRTAGRPGRHHVHGQGGDR